VSYCGTHRAKVWSGCSRYRGRSDFCAMIWVTCPWP